MFGSHNGSLTPSRYQVEKYTINERYDEERLHLKGRFGFDGGASVLIASVPGHCLSFTFYYYQNQSHQFYDKFWMKQNRKK